MGARASLRAPVGQTDRSGHGPDRSVPHSQESSKRHPRRVERAGADPSATDRDRSLGADRDRSISRGPGRETSVDGSGARDRDRSLVAAGPIDRSVSVGRPRQEGRSFLYSGESRAQRGDRSPRMDSRRGTSGEETDLSRSVESDGSKFTDESHLARHQGPDRSLLQPRTRDPRGREFAQAISMKTFSRSVDRFWNFRA